MRTVLCVMLAAAAFAQHHHAPAKSGEKPVMLLKGLGSWTHPISTANPDAQRFFDQGLNLLYGFNRYEALRSFRRASELDPKALMPYWGMAMAQGPHINMDLDGDTDMKGSCAAVRAGLALRDGAPQHERGYIDAVAARCPEYQPRKYSDAMRSLMERYPDDLDAAVFYAESLMIPQRWRWYSADGRPAEGVAEAERVLEAIMRRWPQHPGANHFYIHAVESSPTPERAIPSAQRLMGIVPAAGHLVHMPGHIWLVLGDYETAATVNERAAQVDREYMQITGVEESAYAGYYIHNLHFIAAARGMQGRKADTVRAAENIAAAAKPHIKAMAMMVDAFMPAPIFAALRFNDWDAVLSMPKPDAALPATTAVWHYARAAAFVAQGKRAEAESERAAFEKVRAGVKPDWLWLNNRAVDVLAVAAAALDAHLAGSDAAAVPHWRRAVTAQDALVYDEPPAWFYPVRESLGAALLRAGKAAEAEVVFREGLVKTPRNGRMLFGLMESLKAQKKDRAAALVEREYNDAWRDADVKLTLASL